MKQTAKRFFSFPVNTIARLCFVVWIFGVTGHSCAAAESFDDRRPNEHFCPITLDVMRDPVVAADGHSYERSAISEYFKSGDTPKSPVNGLPLKNRDLFDNHSLKAMIGEWKPGGQGEPSVLETRDANSIAQQVKEEFRKNAVLLNAAKDRHIVAFLGNTGAGKSTLVNLLAGKEIVVSDDGEDYVLAHPDDKNAMVIGTGGNSETLYPKFIDVDGLRFFDLPGFNDTDGRERNLVNAAFTRKILLDAASVRLVVVAGQDQFTADRSASIKQMFHAIRRLFVVGRQDVSLVEDGVFVATKITCNEKTEMTDFLLKKTASHDKADLYQQLKSWNERSRLCRVFHPIREALNKGVRGQILRLIKETKPSKIQGINVSALYPPDTKEPLERMFLSVFEKAFNRNLKASLDTLSDQKECYSYDEAIASYGSDTFWSTFDANVRAEEYAIELLKEFCVNPYQKALKRFEEGNQRKRQDHIKVLEDRREARIREIEREFFSVLKAAFDSNLGASLTSLSDYDKALDSWGSKAFWHTFGLSVLPREDMTILLGKFCKSHYENALTTLERENRRKRREYIKTLKGRRQARVEDIERRTEERVRKAIASIIVPGNAGDDFVAFDFAFHKDYYDRVCASASIKKLATDPQEQEVVRRYYADFISRHSHEQMMRWHQKFSKEEEITRQLAIMESRLKEVEAKMQEKTEPNSRKRLRTLESEESEPPKKIKCPVDIRIPIPLMAQGYEKIYQRFLNGVLIYRPNGDENDNGRINLPIRDLGNPLEGTFDLSRCGDTGKYLSISTGYRKGKKAENASKVEIWFTPRFLIERELNTTAEHFQPIYGTWKKTAEVGIFWTWGRWSGLADYDYLTTKNMDNLSKNNLYDWFGKGAAFGRAACGGARSMWVVDRLEGFKVVF